MTPDELIKKIDVESIKDYVYRLGPENSGSVSFDEIFDAVKAMAQKINLDIVEHEDVLYESTKKVMLIIKEASNESWGEYKNELMQLHETQMSYKNSCDDDELDIVEINGREYIFDEDHFHQIYIKKTDAAKYFLVDDSIEDENNQDQVIFTVSELTRWKDGEESSEYENYEQDFICYLIFVYGLDPKDIIKWE